jgi:phosphohistidine phosphatase
MLAYLLHHADAVGPDVDPQRPLSSRGHAHAEQLAAVLKDRRVAPPAIWHSGKLRARQTAEAVLRACAPFAAFTMVRGLRPEDSPEVITIALQRESRDVMLVGHMPHLDRLLASLTRHPDFAFPQHGLVAVETDDSGVTWREVWRLTMEDVAAARRAR